jgi:hypothetical protein
MRVRIYTEAERKRKQRYHKKYNQLHDYSKDQKANRRFSWDEMYLIWNRKLKGGRELSDIEIAKLLKRSLQSIQLKRHKMNIGE